MISGLEMALEILDRGWGKEVDQEQENSIEKLDAYWKAEGDTMANFRTEFWRLNKKAGRDADLAWSDSYTAKRLVEGARITPAQKETLGLD